MQRKARRRGVTFVELLVASLLLAIGMMAIVQVWAFSFRMTANTDDMGIAYTLGRQAMETAKMSGFTSVSEGSTTAYYDGNEVAQVGSGTARYSVVTNTVSGKVTAGSIGVAGATPDPTALRTVTVTVSLVSGGTSLYQTSTYLASGGI